MKIPEGHQAVMVYLIIKNAVEFIPFTEKVLNAKLTHKGTRDDGSIMHAQIMIGDSTIMFAEASENWQAMTAGIFVYVDSADIAYHEALKLGAVSVMDLTDQSYGRTCGVLDPFGNTWWLTTAPE